MKYVFKIYGEPVAKARPRVCKNHTYTPQKTREYENIIKNTFILAQRNNPQVFHLGFPLKVPFRMQIELFFRKPKKPKHPIYHITKPDADNVCKIYCDALNKLAYNDDGQVVDLHCIKKYVNINVPIPCAYITIETLE